MVAPPPEAPLPIWITVDGDAPSAELEGFLREACPFGVALFARHLREASQVRDLTACIREAAKPAPLIALDQEGGRVSRLDKLGFAFPGAGDLGGSPAAVRSLAFEMGEVLGDLGFQVDFAPVADLGPCPEGTGLSGRTYAADPETVTSCCRAFLAGLVQAGIEGCLKHFPGLGGSCVDSHLELPRIGGSERERAPHLAPYGALAGECPFVMTAHASYEGVGCGAPSSLDPATYRLLGETGFRGTSLTDDLRMGAVRARSPLDRLVVEALEAGAHVALWVGPERETLDALEILRRDEAFLAKGREIPYLIRVVEGSGP